jgi:hypothetical protein
MDSYQQYIHKSRYARYIPEEQRRENWDETVKRYCDYFKNRGQLKGQDYDDVYNAILNLEVMPSMRALMTAGKALDRDNVAGFSSHLGMFQRSDQQEQLLKRLEEELAALNLSLTSSSLQSKCSKKLQDANLVVLNAMISAAKSLRLWLSEESEEAPSSASATSRTTDSEEQSTDSGGQMNHNAA